MTQPEAWQVRKRRSDIFIPAIKSILAATFISEAPIREDREQATDLMVFSIAPLTAAARVRDERYRDRYPADITIRHSLQSGAKTELDKIVDGWGHFFFYGFGDFQSGVITSHVIIDLAALRAQMIRSRTDPAQAITATVKKNQDGLSSLLAIDTRTLRPNCVRAQSANWGYVQRGGADEWLPFFRTGGSR